MITIEEAARRPEWVAPISIPIDISLAGAIEEALASVSTWALGRLDGYSAVRGVTGAWVWIDVAQRTIPGHETHGNGQCPMECSHHLTPETWDPLEGAMLELLWAHSAARNGRSSGRRVTCEQLHAARCALRTWWEMPR